MLKLILAFKSKTLNGVDRTLRISAVLARPIHTAGRLLKFFGSYVAALSSGSIDTAEKTIFETYVLSDRGT